MFTYVRLSSCSIFWCLVISSRASWDNWWTYDGISGPDFWGLLNPKWNHCSKGRKQSPVDINTNRLLFDPGLKPIHFNGDLVEGNLENTGRGLRFNLHSNYSNKFIISNGPLSYEYCLTHLILHFGRENDRGSEHTINNQRFPGELQLYFYNHILYQNYSEAESSSNGLVIISILIQLINNDIKTNKKIINTKSEINLHYENGKDELAKLLNTIDQIKFKGTSHNLHQLNINMILPQTKFYLIYEGSLTEPPCTETAQWIILNKPIYILNKNLHNLRNSIVIDGYGDNFRPIQDLNNRCIRTNIVNTSFINNKKLNQSLNNRKSLNKQFTFHEQNKKFVQKKQQLLNSSDLNEIDLLNLKNFAQ